MRCKICQNEFTPSKYHPRQKVCSRSECQRIRQIQNEKEWRAKNPDYFKYLDQESAWKDKRKRYSRLWKATHQQELKEYQKVWRQQRQEYMREYMHRYRLARNVNRNKS
jgi:hypothetical protein